MTGTHDAIQVENVVASTGLEQELDLATLAMDLPTADYDPEKFPGLLYRVQDPKATLLVFRSGKIVTTGADSLNAIHDALREFFDAIAALGIDVPEEPDPTVQNVVSNADLGERLNLNAIAIGLGLEDVEYEPEQFPGLVYRLDDPDLVVLLFGSGKLVITGATERDEAATAFEQIQSQLDDLGMLGH